MSELLDETMLNELREIMEDDFGALVETFLSESARQYAEVQSAWANQDMDLLRRAAHTLKGSCGNIGAMQLHESMSHIEHQARDGETTDLNSLIANVEGQLDAVHEAVRRI
ncbi:MAG: Hpt domain-containing protein [Pseudomonadota bacterium]